MRLCICGLHRSGAVEKAESAFNVKSVNVDYPGIEDNDYKLFHYAAESFKYFEKENVVFDGGVFDCMKSYSDKGWSDLQEQVVLSFIGNVDHIVVITEGMDEKLVECCNSYAELYPDKFLVIQNEAEFQIV